LKKFKCTEDGCKKEYNDAAHLGIHKRAAHGIAGISGNARRRRELRAERAAAALPEPAPVVESAEVVNTTAQPKRKYAKRRSLQLAKQTKSEIASNGAGENHPNQEGHFAPDSIPEAALALALGRFQELCRSVAYELDLPARMFTERVAAFVYAAQVRQPSRGPMRVSPMR